ncbi:hypothetical protein BAUCODRAFT_141325 [Baudoinia panamericana UAMH 10762]|uniref:Transcription factor IIIC subunit 5 HTH domain-containing protein n=1 Tax=Baudoinia panamericana (strain UAMH 10762) TaxID=717646 RepID=M2N4H3_BAUPA|nr:uncharacterized protein BAUCODRAFT_141325 [Baudoinia panamericana UAMH 10762]EMC93914.1 hypothetical protein BAUCODRAFT_141325 [Baudoinia panamericana UAMH 10762]
MAVPDNWPVDEQSVPQVAPTYSVPSSMIVSIEHPCIVRNFHNGIKSLGGEAQIKHVLEHRVGDSTIKVPERQAKLPEPVIGCSLRPHDPLAKKLASTAIETRNVLVRVTVPKWTGRKRKRGSDEPFTEHDAAATHSVSLKAPELLRRMRDNEGKYSIEPVGVITETHKFRAQADFQMYMGDLPIMQNFKHHVISSRYEDLAKFRMNIEPGVTKNVSISLPPSFIANDQPYRYEYQQAPGVVYSFDEHGQPTSSNAHPPPRRIMTSLAPDAQDVPLGPPPDLKVTSKSPVHLNQAVGDIAKYLETRPMVTKRVLGNVFPQYPEGTIKEATQWLGYSFSAGPFRDTLIKYGLDPRTDPKYRFYQICVFALGGNLPPPSSQPSRTKSKAFRHAINTNINKNSLPHIFDGKTPATDGGKMWQVCDVTEPLLHRLLQTDDVRTECDAHINGWYKGGTMAKVRIIMRDMILCTHNGEEQSEELYQMLAELPDELTAENEEEARTTTVNGGELNEKALDMVREYRNLAKWSEAATNRRLKAAARPGEGGRGRMSEQVVTPRTDGVDGGDIGLGRYDELDGTGGFEANMDDIQDLDIGATPLAEVSGEK